MLFERKRKTETIKIRFHPEEKSLIQEAASLSNLSMATFIRNSMLELSKEVIDKKKPGKSTGPKDET